MKELPQFRAELDIDNFEVLAKKYINIYVKNGTLINENGKYYGIGFLTIDKELQIKDTINNTHISYPIKEETLSIKMPERNLFMSLDVESGKGGDILRASFIDQQLIGKYDSDEGRFIAELKFAAISIYCIDIRHRAYEDKIADSNIEFDRAKKIYKEEKKLMDFLLLQEKYNYERDKFLKIEKLMIERNNNAN